MEDTTSMTMGKRILYHRKRLGLTRISWPTGWG